MITATELRIGNLVNYPHETWQGKGVQRIETIGSKGCNSWQDMGASGEMKWEDISGIPITPEWLVKLGFEKKLTVLGATSLKFDYYDYRQMNIVVNMNEKWGKCEVEFGPKDIEDRAFVAHCTYVHQLQNLYFALTGNELTYTP